MRDFALCRLFLTAGWEPLRAAGAPRWTIRAARLACQAKLFIGDRTRGWQELRRQFDQLSGDEGARWAEVPFEALLTLGEAQPAMEQVWDELAADEYAGLRTLLRLAQQRYIKATFGDPFTLEAVIATTFCSDRDLGQHDQYTRRGHGIGGAIRELVLAWLRGLARDGHDHHPVRQEVRDRVLSQGLQAHDEFAVEALATLGPDTDDRVELWLRGVAADNPYQLAAAVESPAVAVSLSDVRPRLLLELTETYYIEQREGSGWNSWELDDGIRDHQHGPGIGAPMAAWFYGPFFRLLNVLPVGTIEMINRMLDHAAATRVQRARQRTAGSLDTPGEALDGLELDIPGIGPRFYVGDGQLWSWYRGSTVGPYPCMSALLAVERFADHVISGLGMPIDSVVQLLLRSCGNLAMPGLVVGLLIRHLGQAGSLLDPWLTYPGVWRLEFARAVQEDILHVQGPDPSDLVGRDRRKLTPRDVGAELTVRAVVAGDQARLDALAAVADRLLDRASAEAADGPGRDEHVALVEGWASVFRPENYTTHRNSTGSIAVLNEPSAPVKAAFASVLTDLKAGADALRLQSTYAMHVDDPGGWSSDALTADLALARHLAADLPVYGPLQPQDGVVAAAAVAVTSHADGRFTADDEDLRWAVDTVLTAAVNPLIDATSYPSTTYPMAADRLAARAVPALLLPVFERLAIDPARISQALTALATSLYDEVRTALVSGCAPVWTATCAGAADCGLHSAAWTAVQAGLADCRLGPWNTEAQRRLPAPLDPPYLETLPPVSAADLRVNRLAMPIACAAAARGADCVKAYASALLTVLLDAHRRGSDHQMTKGSARYGDPQRELVARVLIDLVIHDEPEPLVAHLRTFAANANALHQMLRDFMILFTYDTELRRTMPIVWPLALETVLDAIDAGADLRGNGHWTGYAVGALLATPQLRTADADPDSILDRARADWLAPEALDGLAERWIALAAGEPKAADAVAQFARTTSLAWQSVEGLSWIEQIIDNHYSGFANHCWFVTHWLAELRQTAALDASALTAWRRVVDGLAAAGDNRAVELQQIDE